MGTLAEADTCRCGRGVSRGPLTVTVDEEGKTRIRQVYAVSAPITGKLQRLALQAGDRVTKDETVVAIIEPSTPPLLDVRTMREQTAQVAAAKAFVVLAEAEVRAARTDLQFAESELSRAETLQHTQAISERALEKARIDVDMRKAALARAQANEEMRKRELESAEARLLPPDDAYAARVPASCCVRVITPESGRILKLIQESERVVLAGSPLVEIGDPSDIEIVVELLSAEAVRVLEGSDAVDRSVGRWRTAQGARPSRRALGFHQSVRPRHRGAARPGDPRPRRWRGERPSASDTTTVSSLGSAPTRPLMSCAYRSARCFAKAIPGPSSLLTTGARASPKLRSARETQHSPKYEAV